MEWFVIYLLVQAEEIRSFFEVADNIIGIGVGLLVTVYVVSAISAADSYSSKTMSNYLDAIPGKRCRKAAVWIIGVGIFCAFISSAIPSQKNMAIIVGSGIVYNAVTSETGQRIGNKGVQLLEKKIDELLGEKVDEVKQK